MKECRFCFSSNIIKNGIVYGKQQIKCKDCKKNFREYKPKYDKEITIKIIKSYLNGMGFRAIERVFNIPNTLVLYWVKKLGKKLEELQNKEKILDKDIIDILEADELFTFVGRKKNEVRV